MQRDYAAQYAELWNRHWWWRARERFVLGRLEEYAPKRDGGRVLNVGCGDGLFMDRLEQWGEVWGIEPDGDLISPDNPFRDRIEAVPFGPGYETDRDYDLIVMLDVLEHIEDDRGALLRLRDMLRPGGVLLLTVPAMQSLWSMHDLINEHHRRYDRKVFESLLDDTGWDVVRLQYYFLWTVLPLLLRARLHPARREEGNGGPPHVVTIPPAPVNRAVLGLSVLEQAVFGGRGAPIGSSMLAVLHRREGEAA